MNDTIKKAIENDSLVLFIGAGISKSFGFPDWNSLIVSIMNDLKSKHNNTTSINFDYYINQSNFNDVFEPLDDLENKNLKSDTKNTLYEIINAVDFDPNSSEIISLLWNVSDKIITTNYDKVLETARPTKVEVFDNSNIFQQIKSLEGKSHLYKIHGDITNPSSCILFRSDYETLYNETSNKETLRNILINKTVLFIGFSLNDPFINHQLKYIFELYEKFGKQHFILQTKPKDLRKYNVETILIDDWDSGLLAFLTELSTFKSALTKDVLKSEKQIDISKTDDLTLLRSIYSEKMANYSTSNEIEQKTIRTELYKIRDRILEVESKKMAFDFLSIIPDNNETELEHLFEAICNSEKLTSAQIEHIQKVRDQHSENYLWYHRSVIVSALACSIINHKKLDPKKIDLLIDFTNDSEDKVWQKGITYLFITLNNLGNKWLRFVNLRPKLELLKHHEKIQQSLRSIIAILQWEVHNTSFLNIKIFENPYFQNSTFNYFLPFFENNLSVNKLYERDDIEDVEETINILYDIPIPDSLKYLFCNNESKINKSKDKKPSVEFMYTLKMHQIFEPYLNYINEFITYYSFSPNRQESLTDKVSLITVNNLKNHLLNAIEHHRALAREASLAKDWNQAISHYEKLLEIDKKDHDALLSLADSYENAEKKIETIIKFRLDIMDSFPQNHYNIYKIGCLYHEKDDYDVALKYTNMSLDISKDNTTYLYERANNLYELNRFTEALKDLNTNLKINSNDLDSLILRGAVYNKLSDTEKSMSDYDEAETLDSKDVRIFVGRAILLRNNGYYEESLRQLDQAITMDKKNSIILRQRVVTNLKAQKFDDALSDLASVVKIDGVSLNYEIEKIEILAKKEGNETALREMEKIKYKDEKEKIELNNLKANVLRKMGETNLAHSLIDEAIAFSENILFLGTKAAIFSSEGNDSSFYKYCEIALKKGAKLDWFEDDILDRYIKKARFINLAKKYNQHIPPQRN